MPTGELIVQKGIAFLSQGQHFEIFPCADCTRTFIMFCLRTDNEAQRITTKKYKRNLHDAIIKNLIWSLTLKMLS